MIFKHRELEFQGLETPTYKLSAIVGADSFFYAIEVDSHALVHLEAHFQEKPLALFRDPFDFLSDLMAENPMLFESFEKKCFGIFGVPYIVVPEDRLTKDSPVRLLGNSTHLAARDTVLCQRISQMGAVCIFSIPEALRHEVEMYFDGPDYMHLMGSLLEWFSVQFIQHPGEGKRIHVHTAGPYILIIGIDGERIVFHNQFRSPEIADIIYFISAVIDGLGWPREAFSISMSGHRRPEVLADHTFTMLFADFLSDLPVQTDWPDKTHIFLDLLAISQCGS